MGMELEMELEMDAVIPPVSAVPPSGNLAGSSPQANMAVRVRNTERSSKAGRSR